MGASKKEGKRNSNPMAGLEIAFLWLENQGGLTNSFSDPEEKKRPFSLRIFMWQSLTFARTVSTPAL